MVSLVAGFTMRSTARAEVPLTLTEQGRVLDKAGKPVVGPIRLTFSLYATATGPSPLWTDSFDVTLDDGYYSVQLGSGQPIPTAAWVAPRFLALKVGSDPEMVPREELTSVPFALVARDVVGDIHPATLTIGSQTVIDASGSWSGPTISGAKVGKVTSAESADMCSSAKPASPLSTTLSGILETTGMLSFNGSKLTTPVQQADSANTCTVARDVSGDIHPTSVSVANQTVIDSTGNWTGPAISGARVGKVAEAVSADTCSNPKIGSPLATILYQVSTKTDQLSFSGTKLTTPVQQADDSTTCATARGLASDVVLITTGRITRIDSGGSKWADAQSCPTGYKVFAGTCQGGDVPGVHLVTATLDPIKNLWFCFYENTTGAPVDVTAASTCLKQ